MNGLHIVTPQKPMLLVVDTEGMTMETLVNWTPEELLSLCRRYGLDASDVSGFLTQAAHLGHFMLYIDLKTYLEAKEK